VMSEKSELDDLLQESQTFSPVTIEIVCGSFVCPCCRLPVDDLRLFHRNTCYVNEELNWLVSCEDCQNEDYIYFADLWADYYSSCFY